MCTLTFIPKNSGFILTSSRDELFSRPTAAPANYEVFGQNIIFPKDEEKGGSWLAMGEKSAACLLNGSEHYFELKDHYLESRGNLVLKTFNYPNIKIFFEECSFKNFAPFTLLFFDFNGVLEISEISWNGQEKILKPIKNSEAKIWSSATLYSENNRNLRQNWFSKLLKFDKNTDSESILHFHEKKHCEDTTVNILMKRPDGKQTTSISQIIISEEKQSFYHKDLQKNKTTEILWAEKEMDFP